MRNSDFWREIFNCLVLQYCMYLPIRPLDQVEILRAVLRYTFLC